METKRLPIFDEYTLYQLEAKTRYSLRTLLLYQQHPEKITSDFRLNVSLELGKSQEELFGDPEEATE